MLGIVLGRENNVKAMDEYKEKGAGLDYCELKPMRFWSRSKTAWTSFFVEKEM